MTDLRTAATTIFDAAVKAADPYDSVRRVITFDGGLLTIAGTVYQCNSLRRIVVVGAGKASVRMAQAVEDILGDRIDSGWINTKYGHAHTLTHITVHECGHPVPDENGVEGTRRIIELLADVAEETLVICLLSGGGSALMPGPAGDVTLADKQEVTRQLLRAGATIDQMNAVRKHLSAIKGGGMARLASPARLHSLILSDVIGDRLDTIASGPTAPDPTTFAECWDILENTGIAASVPDAVRIRIGAGIGGGIPETAKDGDACFAHVVNTIVATNRLSVDAARTKARELGFTPLVIATGLDGEAREVGSIFAAMAREISRSGDPVVPPACIIAGGETTVTVTGKGRGGRNQEMALAVAMKLDGIPDVVFLSGGTDGTDGPTDAAGGIVDGRTLGRGREKGLDASAYMRDNDSYVYLEGTGDLLMTGPTGTNVMDIQLLMVGRS